MDYPLVEVGPDVAADEWTERWVADHHASCDRDRPTEPRVRVRENGIDERPRRTAARIGRCDVGHRSLTAGPAEVVAAKRRPNRDVVDLLVLALPHVADRQVTRVAVERPAERVAEPERNHGW